MTIDDNLFNIKLTLENLREKYNNLIIIYEKFEHLDPSNWVEKARPKVRKMIDDISIKIQDYLTCCYSLYQYTKSFRDHLKKVLEKEEYEKFTNEYDNEKNKIISMEWHDFFDEFITCARHRTLPCREARINISINLSDPEILEFNQEIFFTEKVLLQSFKWKAKAKNYIKNKKEINIKPIITQYQQKIEKFYEWFLPNIPQM